VAVFRKKNNASVLKVHPGGLHSSSTICL